MALAVVIGGGGCAREAHAAAAPPVVAFTEPAPSHSATVVPARPTATAPPDTCAQIRCVALTFDDGPGRDTGRLLDILRERQVRATFFMLGEQATQFPAMVRRVQTEGHVIGNHTQDHHRLAGMPAQSQHRELNIAQSAILKAAGTPGPRLFRPPFGSYDANTRHLGMPLVLWDVDSRDWQSKNAAKVRATVMKEVRSGSIILLHDIHPTTVDAVADLITDLQSSGYALVTVPQLLGAPPAAGSVVKRRTQ